jgi:hypothetical protein
MSVRGGWGDGATFMTRRPCRGSARSPWGSASAERACPGCGRSGCRKPRVIGPWLPLRREASRTAPWWAQSSLSLPASQPGSARGARWQDVANPLLDGVRPRAGVHLAALACWAEASKASGDRTAAAEPGFAQPSGVADADALASADNAAASWPGRVRCR